MNLLTHHTPADYTAWKADFDAHSETRSKRASPSCNSGAMPTAPASPPSSKSTTARRRKPGSTPKTRPTAPSPPASCAPHDPRTHRSRPCRSAAGRAVHRLRDSRQPGARAGLHHVGPRPSAQPWHVERTLRLQRALNNHVEWLLFFTIAVVVVTLSEQASSFTALCAWVYLGARVLYVPAYAFGWRPGRSIIWAVGFTATVLMVISTLI